MDTERLKVVELSGTPRERGRTHGEELRSNIRAIIEIAAEGVRSDLGIALHEYVREFSAYGRFRKSIRKYVPELWDEVNGLAEGAAIDVETAGFLQLLDEEWIYREKFHAGAKGEGLACTAFAVMTPKGTFAGQNMDIHPVDGHQVLFRISYPDDDLVSLVFSIAGTLGLNGMNNAPLGICCNTLTRLRSSNRGLPVAFIVRHVLEQRSFDDAVSFIKKLHHASGQNYVVAAPGRFGSFECSANKVVELTPAAPAAEHLCHTNHALVNDDEGPHDSTRGKTSVDKLVNSKARLESISRRIANRRKDIDIDDMTAALGAHDDASNAVCRHFEPTGTETMIGYTAGSMIYDLDSTRPTLHLASGPPCQTEYRRFRMPASVAPEKA